MSCTVVTHDKHEITLKIGEDKVLTVSTEDWEVKFKEFEFELHERTVLPPHHADSIYMVVVSNEVTELGLLLESVAELDKVKALL